MAAIGSNQKITVRSAAIGKPRGNAVGVLFHAADPLAKLHIIATPVVEHFALQLRARYRTRATANPFDHHQKFVHIGCRVTGSLIRPVTANRTQRDRKSVV